MGWSRSHHDAGSAREILDKRYALGEIGKEEYEEKKRAYKSMRRVDLKLAFFIIFGANPASLGDRFFGLSELYPAFTPYGLPTVLFIAP